MTPRIDILVLALLACTAVSVVRMRSLWAAVMLTGIYSFLGAGWMLILDAPDVAFTEASVGAGIATVLMLGTLALTSIEMKRPAASPVFPLLIVSITGVALVYGTLDMPHFGDDKAPIHQHVAPQYLDDSVPTIHDRKDESVHTVHDRKDDSVHTIHGGKVKVKVDIPNRVTAVLASYRGYDTLGETVVIFAAGLGVLLLLNGPRTDQPEDAVP